MATANESLTSSLEDYLEAVLFEVQTEKVARVRDIAGRLGVGMPSVTAALKTLSKRKLVNYDPYQFVTLTPRGLELAEQISRRHHDLRRLFTDVLGLGQEQADANACRIEHVADEELLSRLRDLVAFMGSGHPAGAEWVRAFQEFRRQRAAGVEEGHVGESSPRQDETEEMP